MMKIPYEIELYSAKSCEECKKLLCDALPASNEYFELTDKGFVLNYYKCKLKQNQFKISSSYSGIYVTFKGSFIETSDQTHIRGYFNKQYIYFYRFIVWIVSLLISAASILYFVAVIFNVDNLQTSLNLNGGIIMSIIFLFSILFLVYIEKGFKRRVKYISELIFDLYLK